MWNYMIINRCWLYGNTKSDQHLFINNVFFHFYRGGIYIFKEVDKSVKKKRIKKNELRYTIEGCRSENLWDFVW